MKGLLKLIKYGKLKSELTKIFAHLKVIKKFYNKEKYRLNMKYIF